MIKKWFFCFLIVLNFQSIYSQELDPSIIQILDEFITRPKVEKQGVEKKIIKLNPDFDGVFNHLRQGREYSFEIQRGFLEHNFKTEVGIEHPNLVFIPYKYNPKKKYQVRVVLHGAVSSFDMKKVYSYVNMSDTSWKTVDKICIFPSSWALSKWWSYGQYENISNLLNYIKENYNVDENDIYISGISDGGTGIYYLSNFYQTPFSCYVPFIGSMEMLFYLTDKQFYIRNYQGLSFLIVNGRKDEIFNINNVIPTVNELKKTAKEVKFFVVDSSKHNTRWYPVLKDTIVDFIKTHKRNPYPDNIYYATEKPDTFCRKFWVKIDRIGKTKEGNIEDVNQIVLNNQTISLFPRRRIFGQIEVNKVGNKVMVKTQDVRKYTLLISPDNFDITKPIEVYTNDILSFQGICSKDISTLLTYYTEDNDRTMLFSSELNITVGKVFKK
jgi:hypothetical protein